MALRKHLRSAWLSSVEQHEFERIVVFHFTTKTGMLQLILELFGEGNIILTDEKNTILQALFFKRMRDRNILRNEVLAFPPPSGRNPFGVSLSELEEALKVAGETEVVRATARFLGIGGIYAEEILTEQFGFGLQGVLAQRRTDLNGILNGTGEVSPEDAQIQERMKTAALLARWKKDKKLVIQEKLKDFREDISKKSKNQ
jgi:predicted ribosome quality control (RQC) complex YloA/Tae2 family protein